MIMTAPNRPSRRYDHRPETAEDTRLFDLREAGYCGCVDAHGDPIDPALEDLIHHMLLADGMPVEW
jgi:hypothetical protein